MVVLSQRFAGLVKICEGCGAVLGYNAADIYENKYLYCPICRYKQEVPLQINYEGETK